MGVQPDGEPTKAMHSYCGGAMSWISGCSSKPNGMPSKEEPTGSFEINQDPSGSISYFQDPSGSINYVRILRDRSLVINQYICLYVMFHGKHLASGRVQLCPLVDSLRFLSHPAPFCFQKVRYMEIEGLLGPCQQSLENIYYFSFLPLFLV